MSDDSQPTGAPRPPPPPPPDSPPPERVSPLKRAWRRFRGWPSWAQIASVVMLVVVFVAAAASGGDADGEGETATAGDTTTTAEPSVEETTTTEAPTTTTTEPPTTTTTAPFAPVIYEGTGTQVVEITLPDDEQAAIAAVSHTGGANFAVWELDADLAQVDLVVNTIGNYTGTVLVNLTEGVTTSSLEITADGNWRVEIKPLEDARRFDASIDGTGDDVVVYTGDAQVMALSHQGDANFAVWFYGDRTDLLANEIGVYDATVPMGAGPAVLRITANGPWSITPR